MQPEYTFIASVIQVIVVGGGLHLPIAKSFKTGFSQISCPRESMFAPIRCPLVALTSHHLYYPHQLVLCPGLAVPALPSPDSPRKAAPETVVCASGRWRGTASSLTAAGEAMAFEEIVVKGLMFVEHCNATTDFIEEAFVIL